MNTDERLSSRHEQVRSGLAEIFTELHEKNVSPPLGSPRGDKAEGARPGDIFVLPATGDVAVEWALLEEEEAGRRLVAVAADMRPMVGSADVAVPESNGLGPLVLRCGVGVALEARTLDPALRTGFLETRVVARAAERRRQVAAGNCHGSLIERETDAEAEYQLWIRELTTVRDRLRGGHSGPGKKNPPTGAPPTEAGAAPDDGGKVLAFKSPWWRKGSIGHPVSLAASVLLAISFGLATGLVYQKNEMSQLAASSRQILERYEALEAEHRQKLAELEQSRADAADETPVVPPPEPSLSGDQTARAADPDALVNVPFAWLTPRPVVRGEVERLALPSAAPWVWLILEPGDHPPYASYRLEIRRRGANEIAWSRDGLERTGVTEVSVALPRSRLGDGEYRLVLYGLEGDQAERLAEYLLRLDTE